jgi:cobalamin biosynthesis protein CobD/CbiB
MPRRLRRFGGLAIIFLVFGSLLQDDLPEQAAEVRRIVKRDTAENKSC